MAYTPPGSPFSSYSPAPMMSPAPVATPAPPALQNPLFGVNPYSAGQSLQQGTGGATDAATVMNSLGVEVPAPGAQTPDELKSNIESSIAKLETVNPDLANEFRAKYLGDEQADEGGLLGALKDIGGAIWGGAGKALELIGRTSHVVPALFLKDDDPWYTDIGEALSGKDTTNWNAVFQSRGWEGDGLSGALRSAMGFALDIGTDPLTYIPFGAGSGASITEKATVAAEKVASRSTPFVERALALGMGATKEEASTAILDVYRSMSGQVDDLAGHLGVLAKDSEEAAQMIANKAGNSIDDAHRLLAQDIFEAADNTYNGVYNRTFSSWLRKGEGMKLKSGTVVNPKDTRTMLEDVIKKGNMTGPGKNSAWAQGRAAAGVIGGTRFQPFVPFTSLRYISPMLPMSNVLQPLARMGRFAAGKAVGKRMNNLIRAGKATWDDLSILDGKGYTALKKGDAHQRELYDLLSQGGVARSAFYTASEMTGKMTAAFSPGASMFRQGLGYYFAESRRKTIADSMDNLKSEMYKVVKTGKTEGKTGVSGQATHMRRLEQVWGSSSRGKQHIITEKDARLFQKYKDYFGGARDIPTSAEDVNAGRLDDWFWAQPDVRAALDKSQAKVGLRGEQPEFAAVQKQLQDKLDDMKSTLEQVTGERRAVADESALIDSKGMDLMNSHGTMVRDVRYKDVRDTSIIHEEDASLFSTGTPNEIGQQQWYTKTKGAEGITPEDVDGHAEIGVGGVLLTTHPTGDGWSKVAPNVRRILYLGEPEAANPADQILAKALTDEPLIARHVAEAEGKMQSALEAWKQKNPTGELLPDAPLHAANWEKTKAKLVTDLLKADGGLQYDAVVMRHPGGRQSMVLMGTNEVDPWDQARVLSKTGPRMKTATGYAPRSFTRQVREMLGGNYGGRRIVRTVPAVEGGVLRSTIDMTFEEAEIAARKTLIEGLRRRQEPQELIDKFLAKDKDGNFLIKLFETDPLRSHEDYLHRVSEAVASDLIGKVSGRMNELGRIVPQRFGRVSSETEAKLTINEGVYGAVTRSSKAAQKAADKIRVKEQSLFDKEAERNAHTTERIGDLLDRWTAGEEIDLSDLADSNPGLSRLLASVENTQAVIAEEKAKVAAERTVWTGRAKDADDVERAMNLIEAPLVVGQEGRVSIKNLEKYIDPNMVRNADDRGRGGWASEEARLAYIEKIKAEGITEPITLEYHAASGRGVMTDGYHRLAAAKEAGFEDIPAIVKPTNLPGPTDVPMEALVGAPVQGQASRQDLIDMLDSGELGIGMDGTITTRSGAARKGGKGGARKVHSREDIAAALADADARTAELDRFAANPARAIDRGTPYSSQGRLVTMAEQDDLAVKGRELLDKVNGTERREVVEATDAMIDGAHATIAKEWGGVTIDMKTGEKVTTGFSAGKVPTEDTVQLSIAAAQDPEAFRRAFRAAREKFGGDLSLENVNMGVFRDDGTGMVVFEPAVRVGTKEDAEALVTHLGSKGGAYDFATGNGVFPARTRRTPLQTGSERVVRAARGLGREADRIQAREGKFLGKSERDIAKLKRDLREASSQMNDIQMERDHLLAKMKPAIDTVGNGDHTGMRQINVPGLDGVWMHAYMAEELDTLLHGRPVTALRNSWKEFVLDPWKKWATYRNPGFHVRNAMGAWFNNALGGVNRRHYHFAQRMMNARDGGKWADKAIEAADFRALQLHQVPGLRSYEGRLTHGQLADMLSDMGMGRGSATAVAMVGGRDAAEHMKQKGGNIAKPFRWADNQGRRASSTIEDYFRTAAWARGMETTGGDLYGSRAFVMMRHGDYNDLTDTEAFVKDLVPFYKWMRTNTPYQLRMMMEEPGKLLTLQKGQRSLYEAVGLDADKYQKNTPPWMQGGLNIPLKAPWSDAAKEGDDPTSVLALQLPLADLYKGANEYVGSFLPVVSDIIESYGIHTDTFTGKQLSGKMLPLAGWAQLPFVKQAIAAFPQAQMGPDGQVYIPDTLDNVLGAIPVYGRFRNWLTGDPNRVEKRWAAITSFMVGMPVRGIDLTSEEKAFYYDVLSPTLEMYQSMGTVFPTKDQLVAAGKLAQSAGDTADPNSLFPDGVVGQVPSFS